MNHDYVHLAERPQRLRRSKNIRRMVRETHLTPANLVAPLFVREGNDVREAIGSMPNQYRLSVDELVEDAIGLHAMGVPAVALFPAVEEEHKDQTASAALDLEGLLPRATRALKESVPELLVITDVALDPYSSDGHDGVVRDGRIANDETLAIMADMAVVHAEAGADIVAPSDMMDGRIGYLRRALDDAGYTDVALLSYTAKYASSFYGPFRDALDSAPRKRQGVPADKMSYQMDPANAQEALRELRLDLEEGADMVMVKPALPYLDVIYRMRQASDVPVAAYHVSGEYAMLKAAAQNGWLDEQASALEALVAIRRAGADMIFTYFAGDAARWLSEL